MAEPKFLDYGGLQTVIENLKPDEELSNTSKKAVQNKVITNTISDIQATINNDKAKGYYHFATVAALPSANSTLLNEVYQVGQRAIIDATGDVYEVTAINSETDAITWTIQSNIKFGSGDLEITEGYLAYDSSATTLKFYATKTIESNETIYSDEVALEEGKWYRDKDNSRLYYYINERLREIPFNTFLQNGRQKNYFVLGRDNEISSGEADIVGFGTGIKGDYDTLGTVILGKYNSNAPSNVLVIGDGNEENPHTLLVSGDGQTHIYKPESDISALSITGSNMGLMEKVTIEDNKIDSIIPYKYWDNPLTIQFTTMPNSVSSEKLVNSIAQYIGTTNTNFTFGHFYKCVSDGNTPATYSWEEVEVQTQEAIDLSNYVEKVSTIETPEDNTIGAIIYTGTTNDTYTKGHVYIPATGTIATNMYYLYNGNVSGYIYEDTLAEGVKVYNTSFNGSSSNPIYTLSDFVGTIHYDSENNRYYLDNNAEDSHFWFTQDYLSTNPTPVQSTGYTWVDAYPEIEIPDTGKVNAIALADSTQIIASSDGIYYNIDNGKVYEVISGVATEINKEIDTCEITYTLYTTNKTALDALDILWIITGAPADVIDTVVTEGSGNPITSGAVYTAISNISVPEVVDSVTDGESKPVSSNAVFDAIAAIDMPEGRINVTAVDTLSGQADGTYLLVSDGKVYDVASGVATESEEKVCICQITSTLYEANKARLSALDILYVITNA